MGDAIFKKLSDILWPAGGTLFGLIVVPIAIEQYPEFFHENTWLLPLSAICVGLCWIVPLILHERARRLLQWIAGIRYGGYVLAVIVMLALPCLVILGSVKLFRFHSNHLRISLNKVRTPDPFSVAAETLVYHYPIKSVFWVVDRNTVCNAYVGLLVDVTNQQSTQIMIRSLEIEMKTASGKWITMPPISTSTLRLYAGLDQKTLVPIRSISMLDRFVGQKYVQSHETVRAWVWLDEPSEQDPLTLDAEFRLILSDFGGATYTSPVLSVSAGKNGLQNSSIVFDGGPEDLSNYSLIQHCAI